MQQTSDETYVVMCHCQVLGNIWHPEVHLPCQQLCAAFCLLSCSSHKKGCSDRHFILPSLLEQPDTRLGLWSALLMCGMDFTWHCKVRARLSTRIKSSASYFLVRVLIVPPLPPYCLFNVCRYLSSGLQMTTKMVANFFPSVARPSLYFMIFLGKIAHDQ